MVDTRQKLSAIGFYPKQRSLNNSGLDPTREREAANSERCRELKRKLEEINKLKERSNAGEKLELDKQLKVRFEERYREELSGPKSKVQGAFDDMHRKVKGIGGVADFMLHSHHQPIPRKTAPGISTPRNGENGRRGGKLDNKFIPARKPSRWHGTTAELEEAQQKYEKEACHTEMEVLKQMRSDSLIAAPVELPSSTQPVIDELGAMMSLLDIIGQENLVMWRKTREPEETAAKLLASVWQNGAEATNQRIIDKSSKTFDNVGELDRLAVMMALLDALGQNYLRIWGRVRMPDETLECLLAQIRRYGVDKIKASLVKRDID